MARFDRGTSIVWRSCPGGCLGYVKPIVVVEDGPEVTVLFQPTGTVCKRRVGKRGGPRGRQMLPGGWMGGHEDSVFAGPPMLNLHIRGTSHSLLRSWNFGTDGAEGWYVNLEAPWRRRPFGFDSEDHVLDVTVADDLSMWSWKDEDELAWAVEVGKNKKTQADEFRAEGERVAAAIERRAWPFDEDWSCWRPDTEWPVPSVPDGWDVAPES